jgi:hypothetical protein
MCLGAGLGLYFLPSSEVIITQPEFGGGIKSMPLGKPPASDFYNVVKYSWNDAIKAIIGASITRTLFWLLSMIKDKVVPWYKNRRIKNEVQS